MKKFFKLANIGLFLLGVSLMAYFVIAGSYVDDDGVVVEEFAAWALGVWMVLVSLVGFLIWGIGGFIKRRR